MKKATPPRLDQIREAQIRISEYILKTPVWPWIGHAHKDYFGRQTRVFLKLESFQHAGSFKPRGALCNMLHLSEEKLQRGVTAFSAGNHAVAVCYSAKMLGTTAKVVMPKAANPSRIQKCLSYRGEVILTEDMHTALKKVKSIESEEGRTFVHPFEGAQTALGTATCGLEFIEQVPDMDAVIIPIGGGGLIAGMASAIKQVNPQCEVYGVEPEGADSMHRSFASGKCERIEKVQTIADSLGAPKSEPYSFSLCQQLVDDLVKVDDDSICNAMAVLFDEMKLVAEPAGAAATAALVGPLRDKLQGKKVGIMICGTNIDIDTFAKYVQRGRA